MGIPGEKFLFDATEWHFHVLSVSKAAILSAPVGSFGLQDLSPDVAVLEMVFADRLLSSVTIGAVLTGTVAGLRQREARPAITSFPLQALNGTKIEPRDVDLARGWILRSLIEGLDDTQILNLVSAELDAQDHIDVDRTSSLALVLPMVGARAEFA
jgi:hypothetical protein